MIWIQKSNLLTLLQYKFRRVVVILLFYFCLCIDNVLGSCPAYLGTVGAPHICSKEVSSASVGTEQVFLKEDFNDLNNWKPLYFPKIKKYSSYTIESNGNEKYLRAESNASASGLIYKKEFNVYEFPIITWRWTIKNIYKNGNSKIKEGDDYPIRVFIFFKYDSEKVDFFERTKYESAKVLYGKYPPHSCLNYVWANEKNEERIITCSTCPYSEKSKVIPLKCGHTDIMEWKTEEVNVIKDYQEAFGDKPPSVASIAIMNDSDNTGESSVSYLDYIEVKR